MRGRFLLVGWMVACSGGGEDAPTDADATDAPETDTTETDTTETDTTATTVSVVVEAATGGTVEAFGATLVVPAGSLSADTEITVTSGPASGLPDAATVLGEVLDFGPDGTAFDPPATLTLPADATLAADERVVVSWLDGQAWTDLPSTAGAGAVSAEVGHFTSFAARVVAQDPGVYACAPVAGCGGDPTGVWEAAAECDMSAGELPFLCEVPYTKEFDAAGGVTFRNDATFQFQTLPNAMATVTHVVPAECLPSGVTDCAALYDPLAGTLESVPTCTGDVASSCTCTDGPFGAYVGSGSGTWSVSGAELSQVTRGEVGYVTRIFPFCVDGDTLTIWDDNVNRPFPAVYTRAP